MTEIRRPDAPGDARAATTMRPPPSTAARPAAARSGAAVRERPTRPLATRSPRRARLVVKKVDPWSVLKFTAAFAIAILVVWVVAIGCLYSVLTQMGVWDHLNEVLGQFTVNDNSTGYQVTASTSTVVIWATIIGGVNAVLFTALATLGAFVYNLCSSLTGGVEVTLTERR